MLVAVATKLRRSPRATNIVLAAIVALVVVPRAVGSEHRNRLLAEKAAWVSDLRAGIQREVAVADGSIAIEPCPVLEEGFSIYGIRKMEVVVFELVDLTLRDADMERLTTPGRADRIILLRGDGRVVSTDGDPEPIDVCLEPA
jgi:hypothetical protein